ncbi:MAG: response regulator transcription factor [Actinobacteria bacterium]|nr:response regulator transcription factor [Actinomycetota bacterium]
MDNMPKIIYIVEDDENILEIISYNLEKNGYKVKGFEKGKDFLSYFERNKPDMVILDLMLPDMDGFDICRYIKNKSNVPVIILSARGEEFDKVLGLELGADDYIVKPFGVRELLARIKNVFKRTDLSSKNEYPSFIKGDFYFDDIKLSVDEENHEIFLDGNKINLNPKEFEIVTFLIKNLNNLSTRKELIKIVWGENYFGDTRTLDVHIRRLRDKMSYKYFGKKFMKTVHGLGYKLVNK